MLLGRVLNGDGGDVRLDGRLDGEIDAAAVDAAPDGREEEDVAGL